MAAESRADERISDLVFVRDLRHAVSEYLRAVDAWELAYQRFSKHRMPHRSVPPELDDAHTDYVRARFELNRRVPRARRLCARFEVHDSFPGLLRLELGYGAPPRGTSTVGRNERAAITVSLAELEACCVEAQERNTDEVFIQRPSGAKGLLQRIRDFFV